MGLNLYKLDSYGTVVLPDQGDVVLSLAPHFGEVAVAKHGYAKSSGDVILIVETGTRNRSAFLGRR